MKDPAVRQGGMALNLEIRTERLTNSVMSMCETLCSQHEICIQMLERRDYQTVYKVMKKEQLSSILFLAGNVLSMIWKGQLLKVN